MQGAVFIVCTVTAFFILVRTDIVRRLAYLVEKGRFEAMREALPSSDTLARFNADARAVAALVTPAVVQVVTVKRVDLSDVIASYGERHPGATSNGVASSDPDAGAFEALLRQHQGMRALDGYGSGFVVDAELGHIVTNEHVIAGAESIHVRLADGRVLPASLLGSDTAGDLAVLQINAESLHALRFADSDSVEVGDAVMSVGNPFGLDGTVSRGIISGKGRSRIDIHGVEYHGFLQTDAVINPGNSGGPLVNLRGEVVAINTAIATTTGHYDGVGFAIPSRRIQQALPALARGEAVPRGYLGVSIVDAPDQDSVADARLGLAENRGVLVREIVPDSPAEQFGLRVGDVIVTINGQRLRHTIDLINIVGDSSPGSSLALEIFRDGRTESRAVVVSRQPDGFRTRQSKSD